jgi:hypothetical protein
MSLPRFVGIAEMKMPGRTAPQKNGNCKATGGPGTKATDCAALEASFFKTNFRIAKWLFLKAH